MKYKLTIKKFSNKIIFFGVSHTKDKNEIHKLIQKIKKFRPEIILIEGSFEKMTFKSEKKAIERGGEMGAVSFFAKKKKVILLPNDPDHKEDIKFVTKKFGKDFANLYFFLRGKGDKDYSDYFNPTLSINKFNIATRQLNKFRDKFMIDEIKLLIPMNKKICIVKGSHHLYENERIINKMIKNNKLNEK